MTPKRILLLLAALRVAACSGSPSRAPGPAADGGAPVPPPLWS